MPKRFEFVQPGLVKFSVSSPSNGEVLAYNSGTGVWENASASGGSDPFTTIKLATDFTTSNTTASPVAITGWTFTPAANKVYLFELFALANAASTATGIRPGYDGGMGGTINCGMYLNVPNGSGGTFIRNFWGTANQSAGATASANATPHLIFATGLLIAGASPSGSFQATLASEVGGSDVTLMAGSIFRYREV